MTEVRTKLRIATWNVEWFFDDYRGDNRSELARKLSAPSREDWDSKRDAVARVIAGLDVDVIALQEAESKRVVGYLASALRRNHQQNFQVACIEGDDPFTEQDVALLYRVPLTQYGRFERPEGIGKEAIFAEVPKHLFATLEVPTPSGSSSMQLLVAHLRSGAENESIRVKQLHTIQHAMARWCQPGSDAMLLGDWNTERGVEVNDGGDLEVLLQPEVARAQIGEVANTLPPWLAWFDTHRQLPVGSRATHLTGRAYDRILLSGSLIEDDSTQADWVLSDVQCPIGLVIGEQADEKEAHWNAYWTLPAATRDVSDHYPVVITLDWR
jgi:endonuclease/exonuclease/phosphatase family metal-dependent hydrolase